MESGRSTLVSIAKSRMEADGDALSRDVVPDSGRRPRCAYIHQHRPDPAVTQQVIDVIVHGPDHVRRPRLTHRGSAAVLCATGSVQLDESLQARPHVIGWHAVQTDTR